RVWCGHDHPAATEPEGAAPDSRNPASIAKASHVFEPKQDSLYPLRNRACPRRNQANLFPPVCDSIARQVQEGESMNRIKLIALTLLVAFFFAGCPTEKDAVRILAADKGVVESEMGKHGECNAANGHGGAQTKICISLNRAIPA